MSPRAPPEQPNRHATSQPTAAAAAAAASVGAAFPGARATFSGLPSAKLASTKVASAAAAAAAAATAPNSQGQLRTQGKDTSALVTVVSENRLVCSQAACNILISYMQYTHCCHRLPASRNTTSSRCHVRSLHVSALFLAACMSVCPQSPLIVYSLLGCSLLFPELLSKIPNAATFGVLCFIGFKGVTQVRWPV